METAAAAPSRHLFGSRKLLHLVRHAQGLHNLGAEKSRDPLSIEFVDPELSSQGWQQVRERKNVSASGLLERIEVVITSPLLRTLQTSVGIFGGEEHPDHLTPSKEANAENDDHCGTSNFNRIPIVASELCRERMRKNRIRGTISQCRSRFPTVDFSLVETEDDVLWEADEKETNEAVAARGIQFVKWLLAQKEKEIAVVSHGVFLQETLIALRNKCYPLTEGDPYRRFENCEIRSVIISNESVMGLGSDSLITNCHCGGIPNFGLELPKDSAEETVSADEVK